MKFGAIITCLAAAAGFVALVETSFAVDPFPRRSILGYTQWQNRQNQQAQQLRQLMRQREVQQLRESQMSRDVDRRLNSLRRRQAELGLVRNIRESGTVDRVLMIPESLRNSVRMSNQPIKARSDKEDRSGLTDVKTDVPAKETRTSVTSGDSVENRPAVTP